MASEDNLRSTADRIDTLVQELGSVADPAVSAKAEELLELVMRFYGAGLEKMLELVDDQPQDVAQPLFQKFAGDPAVATMLLLHGLHPLDIETRVEQAVGTVRPYIEARGGNVTVLAIDDGVVRLNLEGDTDDFRASAKKIKLALDKAILEAAPDAIKVEIEGIATEEEPALIQLQMRSSNNRGAAAALSA